jgi:putative addiction module component (TIGR02574 family)
MTDPMDRLEGEALRLPPSDRAHLARLLLESLDSAEDPAQVAAAWEAEIERRVSEFRSGQSGATSSKAVFREARAQLPTK